MQMLHYQFEFKTTLTILQNFILSIYFIIIAQKVRNKSGYVLPTCSNVFGDGEMSFPYYSLIKFVF